MVHPWGAVDVGVARAAVGTRRTPQHGSNSAVSCETVVPLENITGRVLAKEDISEDHLCLPDPTMFTEK